jgi:hypothetical protein
MEADPFEGAKVANLQGRTFGGSIRLKGDAIRLEIV